MRAGRRRRAALLPWLLQGSAALVSRDLSTPGAQAAAPCSVERLRQHFTRMREQERRAGEAMPSEVQLAVGVFTIPGEVQHREVVRQTWMKQRGVCRLEEGQTQGCSVYTAFVIGKKGRGVVRCDEQREEFKRLEGDPREEQGMLVLNVTENMNQGKTFAFFRKVAEQYPWITHVAKCDMDAYPAVSKLVHRTYQQSLCGSSPYEYAGTPEYCGKHYMRNCEGFLELDFHHACDTRAGCRGMDQPWSFNQGHFYMMSMPLVREVAVPGGIWESPPAWQHEDMVASLAVHTFARQRADQGRPACISIWFPEASCHREACDSSLFNDF